MRGTFVLMDLYSQARAVQRQLRGQAAEEKLAWLAAHGKIVALPKRFPDWPDTYFFESYLGLECAFCFHGDKMVIVGDKSTDSEEEAER